MTSVAHPDVDLSPLLFELLANHGGGFDNQHRVTFRCPLCAGDARLDPVRCRWTCLAGNGHHGDHDNLARLVAIASSASSAQPSPAQPVADSAPHLHVIRLADVVERPVNWLWPRWLARGELSLHGAHPGVGKTTFSLALAAALSTGGRLPDGAIAPVTRTLLMLAEDSLESSVAKGLRLHGADMDRVFFARAILDEQGRERALNVAKHLNYIEETVRREQIGLVVLDPIGGFTPGRDRNSDGDVRDALTPLRQLAEQLQFAVLGILHFGKPNGTQRTLLQSLLGSTGYVALARTVWVTAELPSDQQPAGATVETGLQRVTELIKSNLDVKPPPIAWRRPLDAPIAWLGRSEISANEALSTTRARPVDDAQGWLADYLRDGPRPASDVFRTAGAAGFAERTVRRAKGALGVRSIKHAGADGRGSWVWTLPDGEPTKMASSPIRGQLATLPPAAKGGQPPKLAILPLPSQESTSDDPPTKMASPNGAEPKVASCPPRGVAILGDDDQPEQHEEIDL